MATNSTAALWNHAEDVISNHVADVMLILLLCICTKNTIMYYVILAFSNDEGMFHSLFKGPHQRLRTRYGFFVTNLITYF